ncbi:hypothetical protein [Hoeflea sp. TYP-13]
MVEGPGIEEIVYLEFANLPERVGPVRMDPEADCDALLKIGS